MFFKYPKNTERIFWTKHAKEKMRFYGVPESRVKKVLRRPERYELGIAPATIAVMQPTTSTKHRTEIWVMYQELKNKLGAKKEKRIKIISVWRYPGRSPRGKEIPIPLDIRQELERIKKEPR